MYIGLLRTLVAVAVAAAVGAAVRLDGKVRFPEERDARSFGDALVTPTDADGFYSRANAGRYRVHVEPGHLGPRQPASYRVDPGAIYSVNYSPGASADPSDAADGTLDSLQYCACVAKPQCTPRTDLPNACGSGKVLCCYEKNPNSGRQANSEVFNDIDDEQSVGSDRPYPSGPLHLGPERAATGQFGRQPVLTGPGGPTGLVGPYTGEEGLLEELEREVMSSSSAQRGVLVGPGGPTGRIGPQPSVLVGPGGPTGIIGPRGYGNGFYGNGGYGGYGNGMPAVLVGPGGPTGLVGPRGQVGLVSPARRPVLVGPGGPTGVVGPWYRQRGAQARPLMSGADGVFRTDGERQRPLYG